MAAVSLPAGGISVVFDEFAYPGPNASPLEHARWNLVFARHCARKARAMVRLGLSSQRWLQAMRIARFARSQWLVRARNS